MALGCLFLQLPSLVSNKHMISLSLSLSRCPRWTQGLTDADSPTDDEFSAVVSARKEQDSHQEVLNQQFEADIDQHQEDQSELSVSKAEGQHEMDSKKAEEESEAEQQKEEQEHEHLADLETLEKPAREQRCQKAKAQVQEFCDA